VIVVLLSTVSLEAVSELDDLCGRGGVTLLDRGVTRGVLDDFARTGQR
jgi:hypothetical protein